MQRKVAVERAVPAAGSGKVRRFHVPLLSPLPREFYFPSAKIVAPLLLGHFLVRNSPEGPSGGVIVETEAYVTDDPACHAYNGETSRNRAMWGPPGHAYVYFIYGNHWCFNAVCRPHGVAEAVLVRAIEPTFGLEQMQRRRKTARPHELTNGPGKFCAALGIDRSFDHADLCDANSPVFIAQNPERRRWLKQLGPIVKTIRVGITQAADWPLRFYLVESEFVSRRLRHHGPNKQPMT
jgi:DNA-3-methyladenine glycosylase